MYLLAPLVLTLALSGALYKTKEVWSQVQFKAQTEGTTERYAGYIQSARETYRGRERVNLLGFDPDAPSGSGFGAPGFWNPGGMHVGAFQYGPKGQGRTLQNPMRAEI